MKSTAVRKTERKPEIMKTDTLANLVPINLDDEIRRLAYLFSERRGFEPGHENEDWLNAEREVRERKAKTVCAACPVRAECLTYAVSRPEKYGTWGGLNEEERASERRRRMRRANAA